MMSRRGKNRTSDSALTESLLSAAQAANEEIEMAAMGGDAGRLRSRRRAGVGSSEGGDNRSSPIAELPPPPETFVMHTLEPHHTLAGIALQYSVTVEHLMRMNKLFHANDIHALTQLKIPASRHGALYADPEAFATEADESGGAATHTTARPRAADSTEVAREDGTFAVTSGEGGADDSMVESNAVLQDTEAFLNTFDSQMQTAIQAMDTALQKQMAEGGADVGVVMPIVDTSQDLTGLMAFYPKDWRVVVCITMIGVVVTIPLILYFFKYMYVNVRSP